MAARAGFRCQIACRLSAFARWPMVLTAATNSHLMGALALAAIRGAERCRLQSIMHRPANRRLAEVATMSVRTNACRVRHGSENKNRQQHRREDPLAITVYLAFVSPKHGPSSAAISRTILRNRNVSN